MKLNKMTAVTVWTKKRLTWLKKLRIRSVGVKIFLIFLASVTVFSSAVGIFAYNRSVSLVKEEVGTFSTAATIETADKLKMVYQNYEKLLLRIMIEKTFTDSFQAHEDAPDANQKNMTLEAYSKLLMTAANAEKHIKSVKVIRPDGQLITSMGSELIEESKVTGGERRRTRDYYIDYKQVDWFNAGIEMNGDVLWLPTRPNGMVDEGPNINKPSFGLVRMAKDTVNGQPKYLILVEIHYDALKEQFKTLTLKEGAQKYIVNAANQVIYSDVLEQIGQASPVANPVISQGATNGSLQTTMDQKDVLVSYAKSFENNDWTVVTTIPAASLTENAKAILDVTVIVLIAALVIAVLIGIYMIFTIGRPLKKLSSLMARGELGELSVRSDLRRSDEIGQLGTSFNNMMEQITQLIEHVKESVEQVKNNADEVNAVSSENVTIAKEVAFSMEEIAKGSGELATKAEEGYDNASKIKEKMDTTILANKEMGVTANQVVEISNKGVAYMGELVEKTQESEQKTQIMFQKVDALKQSTGSIRKILDLLNGITKQTNILSLNASIEAARAGEAGKGFMVVANEIRKLADQSRESIEIVGNITEKIEDEANATMNVIMDVKPIYEQQLQSVDRTDQVFKEVQREMQRFIEQLDEVSSSIEQLGRSQQIVTDSITGVSAVAQQTSATTEEVASLTAQQLRANDELLQLSEKLKTLSNTVEEALNKFSY